MQDFLVITKPVKIRNGKDGFSADFCQINYLIQETYKLEPAMMERFSRYEIDKSTVKLELIQGVLHVVMIAFPKNK